MCLSPKSFGEIVDYVHGLDDMQKGLIRVFHDLSFIDDPTRIYRAFRFACEYGFEIEEHTMNLIKYTLRHPQFDSWFKRRKNRFRIEHEKYLQAIEKLKSRKSHY